MKRNFVPADSDDSTQHQTGELRANRHSRARAIATTGRRGVTLIEMLLATAILAVALTVLAQQNTFGVQAALRAELETESALRCQSLLNQLLLNHQLSDRPAQNSFSDDPAWKWQLSVRASQWPGLQLVHVEVFRSGEYESLSRTRLTRLVPVDSRDVAFNVQGDRQ